jgi:hypothetical protein
MQTEIKDILPLLARGYAIDLRDKHIQDLLGISAGTFSRAKNGTEPLSAQDWCNCRNLIQDCEELARRSPLPISWTGLRAVRRQLEALEQERKNPPAPISKDEADLLHQFAVSEDTETLAIELRTDRAELLERVSGILARTTKIAEAARQQK